jgi:hypothetical protein
MPIREKENLIPLKELAETAKIFRTLLKCQALSYLSLT